MDGTDRDAARAAWRSPRAMTTGVVALAVAVAVALAVVVIGGDVQEIESAAAPSTSVATRPRSAPTTAPVPTTGVSTTTSTTAPVPPPPPPSTTAPPPTVAAATVTAPVPAPPAPRTPIRLLAAGDSLGFNAAFPPPSRSELPDFVASVQPAAMIGCGLLAATGHAPIDEAGEGAGTFDCSGQAQAELDGLAARPDWMVFFSGAWEHLSWRTPDGRVLSAGSPELRSTLVFELVRRANLAASFGTRTAFVAWACPHGVAPDRTGAYSHWYGAVLREAAAAVPGAYVVEPTDRVCVGGDAGGAPTAEKQAAFRDHHPSDRAWLWKVWLGPDINGRT